MTAPKNIAEPNRTPAERKARRERTKLFLQESDEVDLIIERIAAGEALRVICREHDITYSTTQVFLAEHHPDAYDAAKRVRADTAIDDLETLEGKLEAGDMNFNDFRELSNSKKWRAEKLNPKRYGDHQTIDMKVTDQTQLHLEALRQMSRITVRKDENPQLTHQPATRIPLVINAEPVPAASTSDPSEPPVDAVFCTPVVDAE